MRISPDPLLVAGCVSCSDAPRQTTDREKVLAILQKRFPTASADQLAAAANALVGLNDEWCEVASFHSAEGRRFTVFELLRD